MITPDMTEGADESAALEPLYTLPDEGDRAQRYVPLAIWACVVLTLLFISLKVISFGFLPAGDARRHVAKAFTAKPYTEIIVMRPDYTLDHSPGWEWLLAFLPRAV